VAQIGTLVLADNDPTEVSEQIGCLKKLRMPDLGHNQLTRVPDVLAGLDSLTGFLYLHNNRLSSLPAPLERLTSLRYLNIGENAFEALPESVRRGCIRHERDTSANRRLVEHVEDTNRPRD
jgi:Leucine-rich repeat (LRR) protein